MGLLVRNGSHIFAQIRNRLAERELAGMKGEESVRKEFIKDNGNRDAYFRVCQTRYC